MDSACKLRKKGSGFRNQVHEETSPYLLLGAQDQRLSECEVRSTSLRVHRNLFLQLSRDGILHGSGNTCHNLSKTILRDILEGRRRRGQQRKSCMDNIKEWTFLPRLELLTRASCRKKWKRISAESSFMPPPPRRPNLARD